MQIPFIYTPTKSARRKRLKETAEKRRAKTARPKHMLNHMRHTFHSKWSVKNEVLLLFFLPFICSFWRSQNHIANAIFSRRRRSSLINYKFAIERQSHNNNNNNRKNQSFKVTISFVEWMDGSDEQRTAPIGWNFNRFDFLCDGLFFCIPMR